MRWSICLQTLPWKMLQNYLKALLLIGLTRAILWPANSPGAGVTELFQYRNRMWLACQTIFQNKWSTIGQNPSRKSMIDSSTRMDLFGGMRKPLKRFYHLHEPQTPR